MPRAGCGPGDPEAIRVDEAFLTAPNLTGLNIRDTILFPLVRPNR